MQLNANIRSNQQVNPQVEVRADTRSDTGAANAIPTTRVDASAGGRQAVNTSRGGASQAIIDANRQAADAQRASSDLIASIKAEEAEKLRKQREEQLRNEQQHRDNDARRAQEAREAQSARVVPDVKPASSMAVVPVSSVQNTTASRPAPAMSANDVISSMLAQQEASTPEEALVNSLIGETWRDMKAGQQRINDRADQLLSEVQRDADLEQERADRYNSDINDMAQYISDGEMQRDDIARAARQLGVGGAAMAGHEPVTRERLDSALPKVITTDEVFDDWASRTADKAERAMEARREQQAELRQERVRNRIDREARNDEPTTRWTDVTGAKTQEQMIDRIVDDAFTRHRYEYDRVRNSDTSAEVSAKVTSKEIADAIDRNDEPGFMRALSTAQNLMMRRFLNPYSLRIEGMTVQTKKHTSNGKERVEARIAYSERINEAIGSVRKVYNCSEYNVLQLVQLRAGLGVGIDGTIANIDPDDFQLTEDQFYQLCRDIIRSQDVNGNPLGPVQGTPGGVRDDTGRFVVVAGTRCFPLGYMPRQLIEDLSASPNSELHSLTERQLQTMVGNQWLNQTYPQLVANTGGKLAYQARAIENMMRAMMAIDGMNPADLDIPEAQHNRTIMAMRLERETVSDQSLVRANQEKQRRMEREVEHWYHMQRKSGGSRDGGARIVSASDRRRNSIGDMARGVSNLTKMSKAANIFIWVTSPIEAAQAMMEQGIGNKVYDFFLYHGRFEKEMQAYRVTDRLDEVARGRDAIEALDVANTLFRIGGNSALTAFVETLDDANGRQRYQMTKADMMRFLQDSGVMGETTITDSIRQVFGIKPGQESAFRANMQGILNAAESALLSTSDIFKESESRQFVQMSMAEMGRASIRGRESYDSAEVEEWAGQGGAQMVRSLLMTDAGHEAFMTQGITSLGRKSPLSRLTRKVMTANGVTELAVRTMFDRFPEYGMAKIERQIPLSNTISYLASYGISSWGDMLAMQAGEVGRPGAQAVGEGMSRMRGYQVGGTMGFWEGLRKNLLYDAVMACNKLTMAALYKGLITMLGGIHRPPEDDDEYNWSEWLIGDDENATPVKWAWWMDDLSGVSLPLGTAWAIAAQGDYSPESVATAANVFINAMANLNSGTALFDAIDLVNNFDLNWRDALLDTWYTPGWNDNLSTSIAIGFWDLFGAMTPTIVEQMVPWSKDSLFRTDSDAHSASYVYDTDNYTLEEAIAGNHVKYVEDENERRLRNAVKYNPLAGLLLDKLTGADEEGRSYRYANMPLVTMADDLYKSTWDRFYLDLSTDNPDVPTNLDERREFVYEWAEDKLEEIMADYGNNPTKAAANGLVLNMDARAALKAYCNHMLYDVLPAQKSEELQNARIEYGSRYLPDDEYNRISEFYDAEFDRYRSIRDEWFGSDSPIPWSIPRYVQQESDWETRYVDDDQDASSYLNYALGQQQRGALRNVVTDVADMLGLGEYGEAFASTITDEQAHPQRYAYGNNPNPLPVAVPRQEGKGYNYESTPVWAVTDKDGNLVTNLQGVYDMTEDMVAQSGRNEGKNLRELFWAGQGTNMGPEADEELNLGPTDIPTLGSSTDGRVWYAMDDKVPEVLQKVMDGDEDTINQILGFDMPTKDDNENTGAGSGQASQGGSSDGDVFYGGSYYGGGGGGSYSYSGGGSSTYNPRIYSSPRQVYSTRAQGMSTRQPYKATSTYLRPSFYTSGSRKPYSRRQ